MAHGLDDALDEIIKDAVSHKFAARLAEHLVGRASLGNEQPEIHNITHWHSQFVVDVDDVGPYQRFRVEVHAID